MDDPDPFDKSMDLEETTTMLGSFGPRQDVPGRIARPFGRRRVLGLLTLPLLLSVPGAAGAVGIGARPRVDAVLVHKSQRAMHLLSGPTPVRSYRVAIGRRPIGHKERKGDGRTPEGLYYLDRRLDRGMSAFHRSIRVSYPNAEDRANAAAMGVDPGANIVIHGLPNGFSARQIGHPEYDWTNGCIAVTNDEMDEIWALVADYTPIVILP